MHEEPYESTQTVQEWLGRRRPRHEAAKILGQEPREDRDERDDIELRDLVMKPLLSFDSITHPAARFHEIGTQWFTPGGPDLLRVYGAAGPGATPDPDLHYTGEWSYFDPHFEGRARADRLAGRFSAGHSLTNGYGQALAGVGVTMVPALRSCLLSVRPYVSYEGGIYLSGRRPVDAWENATSTGWASVGILVESWARTGGSYFQDRDHFIVLSSYSQMNPTRNWRDFGGSASVSDGLIVEVLASRDRRYRIWVYCWAEVQAQMLVSAGAYAGASLSCWMPYLVVEQKPL